MTEEQKKHMMYESNLLERRRYMKLLRKILNFFKPKRSDYHEPLTWRDDPNVLFHDRRIL